MNRVDEETNRKLYDQSIEIFRKSLERARVERSEKENAIRRLSRLFSI